MKIRNNNVTIRTFVNMLKCREKMYKVYTNILVCRSNTNMDSPVV